MNLADVNKSILSPALALLPVRMDTLNARILLLAIGYQESKYTTRIQVGGPAHSFWQMEQGGGVAGVLGNEYAGALATAIAVSRDVPADIHGIYQALTRDDILGAAMARLILWMDPKPLPAYGDQEAAWLCYLKNWRPGKPRPADWPMAYGLAQLALTA